MFKAIGELFSIAVGFLGLAFFAVISWAIVSYFVEPSREQRMAADAARERAAIERLPVLRDAEIDDLMEGRSGIVNSRQYEMDQGRIFITRDQLNAIAKAFASANREIQRAESEVVTQRIKRRIAEDFAVSMLRLLDPNSDNTVACSEITTGGFADSYVRQVRDEMNGESVKVYKPLTASFAAYADKLDQARITAIASQFCSDVRRPEGTKAAKILADYLRGNIEVVSKNAAAEIEAQSERWSSVTTVPDLARFGFHPGLPDALDVIGSAIESNENVSGTIAGGENWQRRPWALMNSFVEERFSRALPVLDLIAPDRPALWDFSYILDDLILTDPTLVDELATETIALLSDETKSKAHTTLLVLIRDLHGKGLSLEVREFLEQVECKLNLPNGELSAVRNQTSMNVFWPARLEAGSQSQFARAIGKAILETAPRTRDCPAQE